MKSIIIILCLTLSIGVLAQEEYNSSSNLVTKGDLNTNFFHKDSTANALVVYEMGNSYFKTGRSVLDLNNLHTEINKKVKVLNRDGFNEANVEILLYRTKKEKEKISDIRATTYNLTNDEIITTTLKSSNIYEEEYNENYNIVKFTLPNIKEGSVITYSYKLTSPFIFKYHPWEFQSNIPKLHSEYHTNIPGTYIYNVKLVGDLEFHSKQQSIDKGCIRIGQSGSGAGCANSIYVMKDIPAFIEEDYMTTRENYLSRIDYELNTSKGFNGQINKYSKSWETVDKDLRSRSEFGGQLTKTTALKNMISVDVESEVDLLKRAQIVYDYIQQNYTWNGKYALFSNVSVSNIIKNKTGNSAEVNILLHNALKKADINVKPVILSTRKNGLATKIYPVISDFNYIIVQININDKTYFLDATEKQLSFGELPFRCLNQYGRLIDFKRFSKWVDIEAKNPSYTQHQVNYKLNNKGELSAKVQSRYSGYHSFSKKQSYFANPNAYLEKFEDQNAYLNIIDHSIESKNVNDKLFNETLNVTFEELNKVNDTYYIDPFIIKFFNKNPFKLQERSYPVDFGYKNSFLYTFEIEVDESYEIVDTPNNINMRLPENKGTFQMNAKIIGNKVMIYSKITLTDAIYPYYFYEGLKQFMSKVVESQTQSLIVVKKK